MARVNHINRAYAILAAHHSKPTQPSTVYQKMAFVMQHWRAEVFLADETRRRIGVGALCQIGLRWHPRDARVPFSFQQIVDRFKELEPAYANRDVSAVTLLQMENRDRNAGD